jgi:outer membrane receptor protein involved in Fe transport
VNQAQSGGAELGATLAWPAALRWFGNYTYTATQDLYLHEPLDYVPAHTANFGLEASHRLGRFTLSGSVSESYVSDRTYLDWQSTRINNWRLTPDTTGLAARVRLHSYWRTDASIRLALGKWAFVSFWIQNAFNAHYEESGGTLAPGRLMAVRIGGGF